MDLANKQKVPDTAQAKDQRTSLAYRDDLAYVHDTGFGRFAGEAASEILKHLRRQKRSQGLIVDLGCGSGILSAAMIDAGFSAIGFDISSGMIRLARERVAQAEFHEASFLEASLPAAIAVVAIGEVFNYCFDHRNSRQRLWRLFRRVFDALDAGGLFLFDVATPGRAPGGRQHGYTEGPGWACLYTAVEDAKRKRLTRSITSFRQLGDLYRRDHEVHQLQLLERAEVRDRLRDVGFRVATLTGYGDMQFPPGYVGFLARKT